jgi:hypothetical protein
MVADVILIRQGRMGKYHAFKRMWFITGRLRSPNVVYNFLAENEDIDKITLPTTDDSPDYLLPLELHGKSERWDCLITSRELIAYREIYKSMGFDFMLPTLEAIEKRYSEGWVTWAMSFVYG